MRPSGAHNLCAPLAERRKFLERRDWGSVQENAAFKEAASALLK